MTQPPERSDGVVDVEASDQAKEELLQDEEKAPPAPKRMSTVSEPSPLMRHDKKYLIPHEQDDNDAKRDAACNASMPMLTHHEINHNHPLARSDQWEYYFMKDQKETGRVAAPFNAAVNHDHPLRRSDETEHNFIVGQMPKEQQ